MTNRLYYDNAYLTEFDAIVTKTDLRDGRFLVALNQSAFYPTSGGQPFDTGTLNAAAVRDVFVDGDGEVWHEIDGELSIGETVHGKIDWERRFDHMQQHGGEHMIAGAFYALTGGMTIGLHLGAEASSIDVELPDGATHVSAELLRQIEDYVNLRIQQDHPIKCWFPDEQTLATLPLRKRPTVTQHVRIVAMGDFEMVACGGTHPSSTGQIGLVKILSTQPAKGKLRVFFVCGQRAYADYRSCFDAAWSAANLLSTRPENLAELVASLQKRLKSTEFALNHLRREHLLAGVPALLEGAEAHGELRLICEKIEGDASLARDLASRLIEHEKTVALIAAEEDGRCFFVFGRSGDLNQHMGKLLSEAAKPLGGKGGGRPDFAQGGGPVAILQAARKRLLSEMQ